MSNANDLDDEIKELFGDIPFSEEVEVDLPSENRLYKLIDPGKPITLRPITFEDEKSLLGAKEYDVLNILLSKCVSNINVGDLLEMDKLYLIMKLREISYGDEYETLAICPKCNSENQMTIRISELNINPVPDDFCEPLTYTLPKLQKEIKIRYPRVKDEKFISNSFSDNIWRFVESIDGKTDKALIANALKKMHIIDVKTIIKLMQTDFGVDPKVKMQCSHCGGVSVIDLPFDANFFNVSL